MRRFARRLIRRRGVRREIGIRRPTGRVRMLGALLLIRLRAACGVRRLAALDRLRIRAGGRVG
jgi:hypothetical protein